MEGNEISRTDRAGQTTRLVYDALDRLVQTIHPDGASSSQEYDAAGRVVRQTDENGNSTQHVFDAAGNQIETIDPLGNRRTFVYSGRGELLSQTDELGHTVRFEYDPLGRHTRTIFPDGSATKTTYDALGREIARTDQNGKTTQLSYDAADQLIGTVDPQGNVTAHAYDELGNRISQTDANGHRYLYTGSDPVNWIDPSGESMLMDVAFRLEMAWLRFGIVTAGIASPVLHTLELFMPAEISFGLPGGTLLQNVGAAGFMMAGNHLVRAWKYWGFNKTHVFKVGTDFEKLSIGTLRLGGGVAQNSGRVAFKGGVQVPWNILGSVRPDVLLFRAYRSIVEIKKSGRALKKHQVTEYVEIVKKKGADGITFIFLQEPTPKQLKRLYKWITDAADGHNIPVEWNYVVPRNP